MTSVAEPAAEHVVDIHTTAGKLADLRKRTDETQHPVGEAAVEKIHAKGKLTARERIYALLDEGSFVELDALARHRSTNFGLGEKRPVGSDDRHSIAGCRVAFDAFNRAGKDPGVAQARRFLPPGCEHQRRSQPQARAG